MNILRPRNLCRNPLTINNLLKNVLVTSDENLSTVKLITAQNSRFFSRSRQIFEFRKPIIYLSLSNRLLCTNVDKKPTRANPLLIKTSILSRVKNDITPYAKIMRIDRPIGKYHSFHYLSKLN